jgi:hypothetical protein
LPSPILAFGVINIILAVFEILLLYLSIGFIVIFNKNKPQLINEEIEVVIQTKEKNKENEINKIELPKYLESENLELVENIKTNKLY